MSDSPRREFGRDGVSGMVSRDRALRARLLVRRDRATEDARAFARRRRRNGGGTVSGDSAQSS